MPATTARARIIRPPATAAQCRAQPNPDRLIARQPDPLDRPTSTTPDRDPERRGEIEAQSRSGGRRTGRRPEHRNCCPVEAPPVPRGVAGVHADGCICAPRLVRRRRCALRSTRSRSRCCARALACVSRSGASYQRNPLLRPAAGLRFLCRAEVMARSRVGGGLVVSSRVSLLRGCRDGSIRREKRVVRCRSGCSSSRSCGRSGHADGGGHRLGAVVGSAQRQPQSVVAGLQTASDRYVAAGMCVANDMTRADESGVAHDERIGDRPRHHRDVGDRAAGEVRDAETA
jgi:hypothetical protein